MRTTTPVVAVAILLSLSACAGSPGGGGGNIFSPVDELEAGNGNQWLVKDGCPPVDDIASLTGFTGLELTEDVLFLADCVYANSAEQGESVTIGFFPGIGPESNKIAETHEGMEVVSTPTLGRDAKWGTSASNCINALPALDSSGTFGMFSVAIFDSNGPGGDSFCDPLMAVTRLVAEQSPDEGPDPGDPTCEDAQSVLEGESDSAVEVFANEFFNGDIDAAFDFIRSCNL